MILAAVVFGTAVLVFWGSHGRGGGMAVIQSSDDTACRGCHSVYTPFIVSDFDSGLMGSSGVMCTDCHEAKPADGDAVPHNGFTVSLTPSPLDCAVCHPAQADEFNSSKHAVGWTKMADSARYMDIPDEIRGAMCEGCHNIGKPHADGSKGKCDSCHTRHSFSTAEARKPESCGTCHMGPDHPQIEAYLQARRDVHPRGRHMELV